MHQGFIMDCDPIKFSNIEENPIKFEKNQIWIACDGLTNEEVECAITLFVFDKHTVFTKQQNLIKMYYRMLEQLFEIQYFLIVME